MPAAKDPSKITFPLPLLVCVTLMVAVVGGSRYWETATGVGYWAWIACGLIPLVAGALIYRNSKRPLDFLGSRPDPEGVKRPGLGGLLTSLLLFLVPRLVGDGAAALALGYRAAETALNRRDAAGAAGQRQP